MQILPARVSPPPNFLRQDGASARPQVMRRSVWTAPAVERAAATLLASLPATYRPAVDFQLLTRESGSVRHDLPIWVSTPHIIRWSDAYGPVQRHDVPGVQGAFVLSNVLAVDECEQILRLSEAMGYTEDAPVSLGRSVRRNENCVWLADDSLWLPIWKRIAAYMPPRLALTLTLKPKPNPRT